MRYHRGSNGYRWRCRDNDAHHRCLLKAISTRTVTSQDRSVTSLSVDPVVCMDFYDEISCIQCGEPMHNPEGLDTLLATITTSYQH
jgi:hypothetical protein